MRYIPNTEKDRIDMLSDVGIASKEDVLSQIPSSLRLKERLDLPEPMSEAELIAHLRGLGKKNADLNSYTSFLGAGAYNHYVPSVVEYILSRSEFSTAYTPYQPEISQGTLQAIFEFQTMLCQLMNMDVANSSMYDCATALAEAINMSKRINKRMEVLMAGTVHPEHREVVHTYLKNSGGTIREIDFDKKSGKIDISSLKDSISDKTSAFVIQYPNFFGALEDLAAIEKVVHSKGAIFIVSVNEPVSLGIIKPPGDYNADIVVAEGQSFGNAVSFGGPQLGIFATHKRYVRYMPGRLVGKTVDRDGNIGFVLTLSTREQHIRRERATSNICSNESLCALAASIYMATMGRHGMRELAKLNLSKAAYAKRLISSIPNLSSPFDGPTFNEFVIKSPYDVPDLNRELFKEGIIGGLDLKRFFSDMKGYILFCVTENIPKGEIKRLYEVLKRYGKR